MGGALDPPLIAGRVGMSSLGFGAANESLSVSGSPAYNGLQSQFRLGVAIRLSLSLPTRLCG